MATSGVPPVLGWTSACELNFFSILMVFSVSRWFYLTKKINQLIRSLSGNRLSYFISLEVFQRRQFIESFLKKCSRHFSSLKFTWKRLFNSKKHQNIKHCTNNFIHLSELSLHHPAGEREPKLSLRRRCGMLTERKETKKIIKLKSSTGTRNYSESANLRKSRLCCSQTS